MQINNLLDYHWFHDLKFDWRTRLFRILGIHSFDEAAEKLRGFQSDCALPPTGFVDAATRLKLVESFDALKIQMIGPYLDERVLFAHALSEEALWDCLANILDDIGAAIDTREAAAQIVAIRGMKLNAQGWARTRSAADFLAQNFGNRTHFSSNKPDYADAMFAVLWTCCGRRHVQCFRGCVDPNGVWPQGTAHLCQGQIFYKIGRHRTRDLAHVESVCNASKNWPESWLFDRQPDAVQYIALEGVSPIEIVRSHADFLDISCDDLRNAELAIASRNPAFVDELKIKINIHTCADNSASSLGCQNILPNDYAEFMSILIDMEKRQKAIYGFPIQIPYTLLDASFIS